MNFFSGFKNNSSGSVDIMAEKRNSKEKNRSDQQYAMMEELMPLLLAGNVPLLLEELERPLMPAIRLNSLKINAEEQLKNLSKKYHWNAQPVPFCKNGYWIKGSQFPIGKTIEHKLGYYYIQDGASMLPVELFSENVLDKGIFLDMAASPGGKTTHLASRSMDQSLILANDSSRDRLTSLRIVLQNWGTSHTAVCNYPGENFGFWFPETFDAILLDAPCSMQGIREGETRTIKPVSRKEINQLANRQLNLLISGLKALKTGGELVYSTCTLTVEENEMVLDQVLRQYKGAVRVEPVQSLLEQRVTPLGRYSELEFDPQIQNAARIWPHTFGTAGFFAALLTKVQPITCKSKPAPERDLTITGWQAVSMKTLSDVLDFYSINYGLNLNEMIEENHWEIWQYKNNLYCFPSAFLQNFAGFPVNFLGLPLAEMIGEDFQPAHEFVGRFGEMMTRNFYTLPDGLLPAWMRGENLNLAHDTDEKIKIVRSNDGVILGRGKPTRGKLKNLLPKRCLIDKLPQISP